ncbi:transposable element Tcb1 transposase [Trichonephila clavipes]|nr:transposable element Tcb1 transposase [Trichonephila clavipes]
MRADFPVSRYIYEATNRSTTHMISVDGAFLTGGKISLDRFPLGAFDQVSEFDRGRIMGNRDCGLSFREIGSRVGRNQTIVMRVCDRWKQEDTTDRRGRSHPPQCTTSREDR